MRARRALLVCCGLAVAGAACGTILDLQAPPPTQSTAGADAATDSTMSGGDTGPPVDSSVTDSSMGSDSEIEGGETEGGETGVSCPPLDAALPDGAIPEGATGATTAYRTMNQVVVDTAGNLSYEFYDTTPLGLKANNYGGGTFDGRYVYFAPANSGIVTRYDTTKPFNGATAFSVFDTTTLNPQAEAFGGAVFDGRYVYFAPRLGASLSYPGLVVRYDTKGAFGSGAAWSVFDTENLGGQTLARAASRAACSTGATCTWSPMRTAPPSAGLRATTPRATPDCSTQVRTPARRSSVLHRCGRSSTSRRRT